MKLAALFSDNMVLQRDRSVPVWGWSKPGDRVAVEFAGQKKTATADAAGKWMVTLDPMPVCTEPRELIAGDCRVKNVLVGDVWFCSGQSNMQMSVEESANAAAEMVAADYPYLRLFSVPQVAKLEPQADIESAWRVCSADSVKSFSAAAYFFGREIWQATGVPLGLINATLGGTQIEPWLSGEALLSDSLAGPAVARIDAKLATPEGRAECASPPAFDANQWVPQQGRPDPGNDGFGAGWAEFNFDDGQWPVMEIPQAWQTAGHNCSGVFWFRREVNLPASAAGKELVLHLGLCDKTDTTYFNGTQVGVTGFETKSCWSTLRVYRIPGQLVRAGRNVIATRIHSNYFQGGLIGPAADMKLIGSAATATSLTGTWRYKIEHDFGYIEPALPPGQQPGPGNPNTPHILYDSMVTPLVPAAIRGVLWYQGESNVARARHYRQLFPLLIRDWRRTFRQPKLPFYFVQISNYGVPQCAPVESGWAELREAQTMALSELYTGMAVAVDVGEANDIHPKSKQAVGQRLARHALAKVYEKSTVCNGPLYRSHRVEGDTVRIEFDHAVGLKTNDGSSVKGFVIAGRDKKFEWAEAQIDGTAILVRSDKVRKPVSVRYAWANNPPVNLYNAEGLPATPFRTDVD
ncbi:MAG: sialate O-acetylesterase [Verrucomicrobiota bacterium]